MDWKKLEKKLNFMDRLAGDKVVWIIVLLLCLISMVAIFSSTSQLASDQVSRIDIIKRHLITVAAGLLVVLGIYKINSIKVLKFFSKLGFALSLVMLVFLDLHLSIGPLRAAAINGAYRIIKLGGFQIHVFEIVKVAMVMYLAWAVETYKKGEGFKFQKKLGEIEKLSFLGRDIWIKIVNIYLPILVICVAALPGGNSNALFIAAIMFLTVLLAGLPFKDVFAIGVIAVMLLGCCIGIYFLSGGEKFSRIGTMVSGSRFKNDNEQVFIEARKGTDTYQKALDKIRQPIGAKLAVKRGGLFGKGPGNSLQKYVVPVIYEDYIFSFMIEEYGLIGGILVILLYISLLARGSLIARNCDDLFAKYAIAGLSIMITGQAMMHILVNCDVGLLTGQTLPMISYGTSSFLCFSVAFGIILSISRMSARRIEKEAAAADPLITFSNDEVRDSMEVLNDFDSGGEISDIEL